MAKKPITSQTETNTMADASKPKRTRTPSGPKTAYALVRVTNSDGEVIEAANVDVIYVGFDAKAVLDKMDADRGAKLFKTLVAPQRGAAA